MVILVGKVIWYFVGRMYHVEIGSGIIQKCDNTEI